MRLKEKPSVFKIKRYLEEMELKSDLSLANIEDIYRNFKDQLKGSNLTAVTEYIKSISNYSQTEIQEILRTLLIKIIRNFYLHHLIKH